jgi:hypothetical protein
MTSEDGASAGPPAPDGTVPRRAEAWSARRFGVPRTRRAMVASGLAVLAGLGVGGWFAVGGPDRQGVRDVSGPPDCPATVPPLPAPRRGLDVRIVPVLPLPIGPVGATLCDYPGSGSGSGSGSASVHGAVLDAARTSQVAGWLDSGRYEVAASPAPRCPADDGSAVVITFRYADGPPAQVTVHRSGCRSVSNGVRTEMPRSDVLTLIDALVPPT